VTEHGVEEAHRFWCNAKEDVGEPVDQPIAMMNPEVAVAIANESGMEPPSGATVTARGTATGRAERRTEREKESHVRERAMATIAAGIDATLAGNPHHANPATVTLGQHTHGVTAAAPNRPLLAPPANQWAIRPTLPYVRPTDNPGWYRTTSSCASELRLICITGDRQRLISIRDMCLLVGIAETVSVVPTLKYGLTGFISVSGTISSLLWSS
jgi:hypothetical protein